MGRSSHESKKRKQRSYAERRSQRRAMQRDHDAAQHITAAPSAAPRRGDGWTADTGGLFNDRTIVIG